LPAVGNYNKSLSGLGRSAMKSRFWILAFLGAFSVILGLASTVQAQELAGTAATKENLDLPFDAIGDSEEEEDAPEIVTFYGQQMEGDGIFYVIDKSGSMRDSGELDIAKREVTRNVQEFSSRVQFAIVFFDAVPVKYPASGMPAEANPGMKSAAISFIQAITGNPGSCCQQGLAQGLRFANMATSKRKVMVYVGDGGGTCQGADEATYLRQTLGSVTSQNYQRVQINCIGVLNPSALGVDFMKRLAATNGGTYTRITR
jgi:Mg-chelatase subunit ChlD